LGGPTVRVAQRVVIYMDMHPETLHRAFASRDPRLDGHYFVGANSTKVFCRPICRSRIPKLPNCKFFASAADAVRAGFRPCQRCRPDVSRELPAARGTLTTVARALRLIAGGDLDETDVESLATRLGVGERHLRRLFVHHLGVSPSAVLQAKRAHLVRKMAYETSLSMTEVAYASGFRSLRRFNDAVKNHFGCPPRDLRRRADRRDGNGCVRLKIKYCPPFDWTALTYYLQSVAIPGVERVDSRLYRRSANLGGTPGIVCVVFVPNRNYLLVTLPAFDVTRLGAIVERVRTVFDAHADPGAIAAHLQDCRELEDAVASHPGIRVSGAWDRFELTLRTLVECEAASARQELLSRMVTAFGRGMAGAAQHGIDRLFPEAADLAAADLIGIGMRPELARAINAVAARVADGSLLLDAIDAGQAVENCLLDVGCDPRTAAYVAARIDNEGDAFSLRDWRFQAQAAVGEPILPANAPAASSAWGPWRGYAAMALWAHASAPAGVTPPLNIDPLPPPLRGGRRDRWRRPGSRSDTRAVEKGCPLPARMPPAAMQRSSSTRSRNVSGEEEVAMQRQAGADPERYEEVPADL